jgi:type II secretory ATPase GspE/PulE/Tfp pilus assembly ATPase PilB-like protein
LREAIRTRAPAAELRALAVRSVVSRALLHDAVTRVVAGQTTPEEVIRVLGAAERS